MGPIPGWNLWDCGKYFILVTTLLFYPTQVRRTEELSYMFGSGCTLLLDIFSVREIWIFCASSPLQPAETRNRSRSETCIVRTSRWELEMHVCQSRGTERSLVGNQSQKPYWSFQAATINSCNLSVTNYSVLHLDRSNCIHEFLRILGMENKYQKRK